MRNTGNYSGDRYNPGGRPPLDQLPDNIVALLTEYDAALVRLRDARGNREHLGNPDRDKEARRADAAAAAAAARAGKKIPQAANATKLANDRDDAERAFTAHQSAVQAIRDDLDNARAEAPATGDDRTSIDKATAEFVATVEQAIADRAAGEWMRGSGYSTQAATWAVDIIPALGNHGLSRSTSPTVHARAIINNLIDALLED